MIDPKTDLDEALEEPGAGAAAQEEDRGALERAQKLLRLGLPLEGVISATRADPEKLRRRYSKT